MPHSPLEEADRLVRILLVEDNAVSQKFAQLILAKAGCQVVVAGSGREAVDIYASAPGRFDLIFMDVQMPEMDGLQATRAIRERGFVEIPIIAMTAGAVTGDREECLAAGMNDYMAKPVSRESVYEIIQQWVFAKDRT